MRALRLLLPMIAATIGCTELPSGLARFQGTFSYMASDQIGRPAFGGTLDLVVHTDSSVTGQHTVVMWRIVGSDSTTLIGHVTGDSIYLLLDPSPDAGILITARATADGFSGTWERNTIGGPLPGGNLFAQRTNDLLPTAP